MAASSPGALKGFAALIGVTSVAIFVQAVTAGEFVSQKHRGGWITAHNVTADVVTGLALGTMVFAIVALRRLSRALLIGSIALFVLVVVQTMIGHEITDNNQNWLVLV